MVSVSIVKHAVELLHLPSRVKTARTEPLPTGVADLIAIAAGNDGLLAEAAAGTERPPQVVKVAANFYIEQILMAPSADSYRVLGATQSMNASELRHHMTLLMKWLHPDAGIDHGREAFTSRVNSAWDDLKTPERRACYDIRLNDLEAAARRQRRHRAADVRKQQKNVAPNKAVPHGLKRIPADSKTGRLRRAFLSIFSSRQQ